MIRQCHRRTDEQTDIQATCDSKTAICTMMHRVVKMDTNGRWSHVPEEEEDACRVISTIWNAHDPP